MSEELTEDELRYFETKGKEAPEPEEKEELVIAKPEEAKVEPKEVKEEPKEAKPEVEKRESQVPYGALKEEREKRKKIDAENSQLRERIARMEGWMAQFQQNQQPEAPQVPDKESDPVGYLEYQAQLAHQRAAQAEQAVYGMQQNLQMTREDAQRLRVEQHVNTLANTFAQENPDYFDALNFAVQSRDQELQQLGYTDDIQVPLNDGRVIDGKTYRQVLIGMTADELIGNALSRGENPAKWVYELAKQRGYQKKQAAPPVQKPTVQTLKKGIEASSTLSNAPSAPTSPGYSLEALADDNDAFETFFEKHGNKGFRKLMGG